MSRENRKSQSGDFGLVIVFGILACWFFGLNWVLESLAVGSGAAAACAMCALSIVALVRRIENRSVLQVVAIRTVAATYLLVFSLGLTHLFMLSVEGYQQSVAMQAELQAQFSENRAQYARMRASFQQSLLVAHQKEAAIDDVLDATVKTRYAR